MKAKLIPAYLLLAINCSILPQTKYPADTLLVSSSLNLVQKAGILPIAAWQRISYNLPGFACQFYPSCSNYGTQAITEYGLVAGSVVTADRIVRCNPFAWHYHLQNQGEFHPPDSHLVDPVIPQPVTTSETKSPYLAAVLSAVAPGSGRLYAGRPWDGLMGFMNFSLFASFAYSGDKHNRLVERNFFLSLAAVIYLGEIYGAWRAAKYYQARKTPVHKVF